MEKKKLSFVSAFLMAVGSIIGAGIFASTPVAIKIVGGAPVVLGFLFGALFLFIRSVSSLVMVSSLPATGSSYMQMTRLTHPGVGMLDAINMLVQGPLKIATLSLTFSTYFCMLFPAVPGWLAAAICIVAFTVLSTHGLKASSLVQNVSVIVLVIALGLYIFLGMPHNSLTLKDVLMPTIELTKLWAAIGILHGSLMGANVLIYCADEVEKPAKNIPIIFILSTLTCAVLYGVIGWVTVGGPIPWYEIKNLANVAETFMSPGMLAFFISGGALLAVVTSINAAMLMFSRAHYVAARDRFFPDSIAKINKYGVPGNAIWLNSAIALIFVLGGFNLADVTLITSIPGLLMNPIGVIPLFYVMKKYPLCYKNNFLHIPHWLTCTFGIVAAVLSIVLGYSVVLNLELKNWLAMLIYYTAGGIYVYCRIKYLKKQGCNLVETMRAPYEPWEKREQAFRDAEAAKAAAN